MGKLIQRVNDLDSWCRKNDRLDLLAEWDYKGNHSINPEMISAGSHYKVYWVCSLCGHKWFTEIRNRTQRGYGCPNCKKQKLSIAVRNRKLNGGKNSLAEKCPQLLIEWDYEKNLGISPTEISSQSHKNAFWICENGHSYSARVQNRVLGSRCPYCSGKKPIKGKTDLMSTNPEIIEEWDFDKNTIKPDEVFSGSEKNVYWIGKCGHSYKQMIANHVNGHGCPICSNKTVLAGVNDLATKYPEIAKEWDYEKNNLTPSQVLAHSQKKAWWLCPLGHSYCMVIGSRTCIKPQGCSICAKEIKTSFPEQAIYYFVSKVYSDVVSCDRSYKVEFDISIPSLNTAIEYDGLFWHKNKKTIDKDNKKDLLCKEKGIRLIRFRDMSLPDTVSAERITCKDGNLKSLEAAIMKLFDVLGTNCPIIDLAADSSKIMANYIVNKKENSLSAVYPELVEEWNFEKNYPLSPNNISWGSAKKVWWKCTKCQKEWLCSPANRTGGNYQKCPRCTKAEVSKTLAAPVMNVDTGEVFDSLTSAAKAYNGRQGDISEVCRGRQKTAFGYHWEYVGEVKKSRVPYKGKVINLDTEMVFDSLNDAASWCNGKAMNISACCRGRQKTAYGYRWKFKE